MILAVVCVWQSFDNHSLVRIVRKQFWQSFENCARTRIVRKQFWQSFENYFRTTKKFFENDYCQKIISEKNPNAIARVGV